jgi:hypothetical protein
MSIPLCQDPPVRVLRTLPSGLYLGQPATSRAVSLFDMLQRYAFSFYEALSRIESLRYYANLMLKHGPAHEHTREEFVKALAEISIECKKLSMLPTTELVSHIQADVARKGKDYTCAEMANHLETLYFSFISELRRNSYLRIASENDKYFDKDELFGLEVAQAFESCADEIKNAGNCYALEQYEASVFHAMRVLERGLSVLAGKFGVDSSNKNWHNVIEEVEKSIRKMDSSFGPDWKEQQKFCAQAATHFMFLKDAWRNHVMHVKNTPYDAGRAFSVFEHVRQFMQALAEGGLKE